MTTNQEGVHATVRALTSTSRSYNEDWHALFDADGIAAGNFNSRMLAWINATLSSSYTNINEAMQAFAVEQGFANWASMNTFSVSFDPATVANALGFWDVSNLATLFQERTSQTTPSVADGVTGSVTDLTGNGRTLASNAADSRRPLLRTGSVVHLEFDGIDDNMRAVFTANQPFTRISLLKQISWTVNEQLLDGASINSTYVPQTPSSPAFYVRSVSGIITPSPMPAVGNWFVLAEVYNGASSKVQINKNAAVTGTLGATNPGGITIAGRGDGAGTVFANIGWGGTLMVNGVASDADITATIEYFMAKAGLS